MEEGAFNGPKPIITNNPKDPRLRSYNDSLNLYNQSQPSFDKYKKWTKDNDIQTNSLKDEELFYQNIGKNRPSNSSPYNQSKIKPIEEITHHYMRPLPVTDNNFRRFRNISKGSIPTDYLEKNPWTKNSPENSWKLEKTKQDFLDLKLKGVSPEFDSVYRYKKPVQPIVYKKPEPIKVEEPVKEEVTPQVQVQTPAPVVETPVTKVEPTPTQPISTKQKVPTIRSSNNYGDTGTVNYGSLKEVKSQMPAKKGPSQWKTTKSNFTMKNGGLLNAYKNAKHGAELYDPRTMEGHIVGMKKGGSPLNRPITCSNCGHSWTVSDSGPNPLSCHNCGGVAKMQMGGLSKMPMGGINDINSKGDFNYNVSQKVGNVTGSLQGSVNVPTMTSNYMQPKISYDRNGLSAYKTLTGFGAGVRGDKTYLDYNQDQQGKDIYQTGSAGYNSDKVNLNANATYKNNVLDNAGIQGNYNVTPNLSLSGNYNVSRGEFGMNPNYFAGFRYNKTFKEGGKVDHSDDKDMVNGVASILRRVKDKKNRLQLANQMSSQFKREKVKYSLNDFLNKSKVKK